MTDTVTIRRELLERIIEEHAPGYHDCIDLLGYECEWCELRAILAAPVQGVNTQLLEALNGMLLHIREPESESEFQWPEHFKKQKAAFAAARAAIAAARKGEV